MKNLIMLTICLLGSQLLSAQIHYIHCGHLWTGEGETFQKAMTIVTQADTVLDIRKGYAKPTEAEAVVVDLKEAYVMPGLMDMHVHLESESSPRRYLERYTLNEADIAFRAQEYARRTLMAGFTTVRDLGGTGVNTALRNAINSGWVIGPRIYSCGKSLATTGGHADPSNGMKRKLMGDPGPAQGVVNSAEDARKAVRQRYKNGADLIKITATGGVLSVAKDGQGPQFQKDELAAIISTANDYGMTTAAHAHGADGMKRAVIAGISSIEHGTFMTDEIMELMKQKGTYYVPTITAGKFVAEKAKQPGYYPTIIIPKALKVGPQIQSTFEKAYKADVKIAFGTDSGVSPHGDNAEEFVYMTEVGMPVMEALHSATVAAADLLNVSDEGGTISPGKWADIIAVPTDPVQDVTQLQQVFFVMKAGQIYRYDQ